MKIKFRVVGAIILGLFGLWMFFGSLSITQSQSACGGNDLIPSDLSGGLAGMALSLPLVFFAVIKFKSIQTNQINKNSWYKKTWVQFVISLVCFLIFGYVVLFRHLLDGWCF